MSSKKEQVNSLSGEVGEFAVTVPEGVLRQRADKVLTTLIDDLSRSQIQKLFDAGRVWTDDKALSKSDKLSSGMVVSYSLPPEEPLEVHSVDLPLDVLFEDDHVIVVNKAPGMVVHPGAGTGNNTLVHGLLHHTEMHLSTIGGSERPGIVHRLDKETSGVIIAAKSDTAFRSLSKQFSERETEKYYTALVSGIPNPERGEIDFPIGRHPKIRTRMTVRNDGRPAFSKYEVLAAYRKKFSLVKVHILTGRTHQIRVHLAHNGNPLAGDVSYGYKPGQSEIAFPRVMLHANSLGFRHPKSREWQLVEAPLPADFLDVIERCK